MSDISFEVFLEKTALPSTAKEQLPKVISKHTQRGLLNRADAEEIITAEIDEIDHGSVETIEVLVSKRINQRN